MVRLTRMRPKIITPIQTDPQPILTKCHCTMIMCVLIIYRTGQILSGPEQSWTTPAVTHEALTTAMEPMRVWWPPGHVGLVTPEVRLKSNSGWSLISLFEHELVGGQIGWNIGSPPTIDSLSSSYTASHPSASNCKKGWQLSVSLFWQKPVPIFIAPTSPILIPLTKSSLNFSL